MITAETPFAEPMFGTIDGAPMTAEQRCGLCSPEFIVDWLIKHHGLSPESRNTVVMNLQSQFRNERAVGFIEGRAEGRAPVHIHFSLFGGHGAGCPRNGSVGAA